MRPTVYRGARFRSVLRRPMPGAAGRDLVLTVPMPRFVSGRAEFCSRGDFAPEPFLAGPGSCPATTHPGARTRTIRMLKLAALAALGFGAYRYIQKQRATAAPSPVRVAGGPLSSDARVQPTPDAPTL